MKNNRAQSIIEFCFASVVLMFLLYGMVQTVRWIMLDLAERRFDHDAVLTDSAAGVEGQLNPYFHRSRPVDGAFFRKGH